MATATYDIVIPKVLAHEGGYVDHPKDPGGPTNKGITQATYDAWRKARGLAVRSVRAIGEDEVAAIYRRDYWNAVGGDALPAGTDYAVFDAGVNSGPGRAAKWLQQIVRAPVDGAIGPVTVQTVAAYAGGQSELVKAYCARRLSFMQSLNIWQTFRKGWTRRVAEVEAFGVVLALKAAGASPADVEILADREAGAARSESNTSGGIATSAGAGGTVASQNVPGDPGPAHEIPAFDPGALRFLIIAITIAALAAALFFAWRWWVNRQRSQAYARAAAGAL
jgi:lysozyme family protein